VLTSSLLHRHAIFVEDQEGPESEKRESKKQNSGIRFMDAIASRKIAV
jgi:hypothetical protein